MGRRGRSSAAQATTGVMLAALASLSPVCAQERLLALRVGGGTQYESNVFRLPDAAPDPQIARGISGKSDHSTTGSAGLTLAKAYAQQRFLVDVAGTATRYEKFSSLDREGLNYRGEWQWQLTPRLGGLVSADRSETPVPVDEQRDGELNELVSTARQLTLTFTPFSRLQLLAGAQQSESRYRRPFPALSDSEQSGVHGGLRYALASGSAFTVLQRRVHGRSLGAGSSFVPTGDFEIRERELSATWVATARSTLDARLTQTNRTYEDAPERDFSGRGVDLSHAWVATGRLTLNSSFQRRLSPYILDTRASYRDDRTLSVGPSWEVFEKLRLLLTYSHQRSLFRGGLPPAADPARRDDQDSTGLSAEWRPYRPMTVRATVAWEKRESTDALQTFDGVTGGVQAAFTF